MFVTCVLVRLAAARRREHDGNEQQQIKIETARVKIHSGDHKIATNNKK